MTCEQDLKIRTCRLLTIGHDLRTGPVQCTYGRVCMWWTIQYISTCEHDLSVHKDLYACGEPYSISGPVNRTWATMCGRWNHPPQLEWGWGRGSAEPNFTSELDAKICKSAVSSWLRKLTKYFTSGFKFFVSQSLQAWRNFVWQLARGGQATVF